MGTNSCIQDTCFKINIEGVAAEEVYSTLLFYYYTSVSST